MPSIDTLTSRVNLYSLVDQIDPEFRYCQFRAVELSRLGVVLQTGIDVEPPDAVFFASDLDKTWEYGAWPKSVLALDAKRLQRTFRRVRPDISAEELAFLKETFPVMLRSQDEEELWRGSIGKASSGHATHIMSD